MAMEFRHSVSLEAPLVRSDSRLEAYSDALFSILATVMVSPCAQSFVRSLWRTEDDIQPEFSPCVLQ